MLARTYRHRVPDLGRQVRPRDAGPGKPVDPLRAGADVGGHAVEGQPEVLYSDVLGKGIFDAPIKVGAREQTEREKKRSMRAYSKVQLT